MVHFRRILLLIVAAFALLPMPTRAEARMIYCRETAMKYSVAGGRIKRIQDDSNEYALAHNYVGEVKVGETITLRYAGVRGFKSVRGTEGEIAINPMSSKRRIEGMQKATESETGYVSGHMSYTVEADVSAISAFITFTSYVVNPIMGAIPYTVSMWIDYKVVEKYSDEPGFKKAPDNVKKFDNLTADLLPAGDGSGDIGDDEEDTDYEEDNEALISPGVATYLIPAAVISVIIGGGAAAIRRGKKKKKDGSSGDGGDSGGDSGDEQGENEEPDATYSMHLYKDFGDTLVPGEPPRQVFARIVKTVKGQDSPDPQLTSRIQITSGAYLNVVQKGMNNGWMSADVEAPEQDPIPEEGIVTFRLAGGGGSYTNRIHFRIEQQKALIFMQDNVTFIAGEKQKMTMSFRVFGVGDDPEFNISLDKGDKSGIDLSSVRPDEAGMWCFDIADIQAEQEGSTPGDMDRFICTVSAKTLLPDGGEKEVSESFTIYRFYEGIRLDVGHIKAYNVVRGTEGGAQTQELPTSHDQNVVPAHTPVYITLYAWDKEKNWIGKPIPEQYKVRVEDVPDSVQFYGKKGERIEDPCRHLGFKTKHMTSMDGIQEGCVGFDLIPSTIMIPPNRAKAKVSAEAVYGGKTYRTERTVMVLSMPYRTPEEIDNAWQTDDPVTQRLKHMQEFLLSKESAPEVEPLIARIGLFLDSYDKRFGYYMPDYSVIANVFYKFASGEVGALYANEHAFNWHEFLFGDVFDMTVKDMETYIPENMLFRVGAGIVTGGLSEVYYTPKEFLVMCRDYAATSDKTDFWDCFKVGAVYGARQILMSEGMKYGFKKLVAPAASAAYPGIKEMAVEFKSSASSTFKQLTNKLSAMGYTNRLGKAIKSVQDLRLKGKINGKIKLDAAREYMNADPRPGVKALRELRKFTTEQAQAKVDRLCKAFEDPDIPEATLKQYVMEVMQSRQCKNLMNAQGISNKYKFRYTTESQIIAEHTKIAFKKTVAKELGVHESRITFQNATGHKAATAVSKQKVGMDYDFSPKIDGKDLPESYSQRIWNNEFYKQATGTSAPSAKVAAEYGHLAEQTAVNSVTGVESFKGDLDAVLNAKSMAGNPLQDAANVQRVTLYKITEPLREAQELANKALQTSDMAMKKMYYNRAVDCIQESGRNVTKAMPRSIDYKLEHIYTRGKGHLLDSAKVERIYNLNGRMENMMERSVNGDPDAIIETMLSFEMEGQSMAAEVEGTFSLITEMDNIICNG